jgi:predicted negative regulator of RcsB-dependent stress response
MNDRIWLFFQKNSKIILVTTAIIVSIATVFGFQKLWQNHEIANMQTAYASIKTKEDKILFVKKYKRYKLAGVVSLVLGDDYLENSEHELAKSAYKNAGAILKHDILFPRAVIGQAMTEYKSNNATAAGKLLNSIIYDEKFDRVFRGNAAYALANILKNEQKSEQLDSLLKDMGDIDLYPKFVNAIHKISEEN